MTRVLQPKILETKEDLLNALKTGQLKTSKYNLLSDTEKLFVELITFGGYTSEQAIKCIDPKVRNPLAIANRMTSSPDVAATLEELSISKDKKFAAEISSVRDIALSKLKYIMCTTSDDSLAASCAKIILDKSEAVSKNFNLNKEPVGDVKFSIQVQNNYVNGSQQSEEPVIIPIDAEYTDACIEESNKVKAKLEADIKAKQEELEQLNKKINTNINPDTGLEYTIVYEGVDNYNKDK